MPSRLRSNGSSSASSGSSGIASTSPAPNSGIGARPRHDVHIVGNDRLAGVRRHREQVHQRVAGVVETAKRAGFLAIADARLEHHAAAADGRHAVAHGAARAVERRSESVLGGLDLGEVVEAQPELREFDRRDARQRIARLELALTEHAHRPDRHAERTRGDPEGDARESSVHRLAPFGWSRTISSPRMKL